MSQEPDPDRKATPAPAAPSRIAGGGARPARTWRYHLGTALLAAGLLGLLLAWVVVAPGAHLGAGGPLPPAPTPRPTAEPPPRLALATFKQLYDQAAPHPFIVDVRSPDAYAAGHIPGAVSIPSDDLTAHIPEIPADHLVVLYCQ
ncbi:MAG TPA: rhodanese-like domain-containing protein [Chloroflexia bacterium]|nr:rhodanese-like domain-containing protein [Chloroflexia bacterium]